MDDVFEPTEKRIYKFSNGEQIVAADPLALRGALTMKALERGKALNALIDTSSKIDVAGANEIEIAEAWGALMMLAEIATEAFGLIPFDNVTGAGADTAHALGVLNHFHVWCEKKNQSHVSPPTFTPPLESTSEAQPITDTSSV